MVLCFASVLFAVAGFWGGAELSMAVLLKDNTFAETVYRLGEFIRRY